METRWKEARDFDNDGLRIKYFGGIEIKRGVAVVLDKSPRRVFRRLSISTTGSC